MGKVSYVLFTLSMYFFCWPIAFWGALLTAGVVKNNVSRFLEEPSGWAFFILCIYGVHYLACAVCRFFTRLENRIAPEVR